jgi:hypothetical protein
VIVHSESIFWRTKAVILEKASSKEWKLSKFLETLECRCLKWEETILESLEKAGFKTFFESLERGSFERKESLHANGFRVLTPFFCSRQVQCSPHIGMFRQRKPKIIASSQQDEKNKYKSNAPLFGNHHLFLYCD